MKTLIIIFCFIFVIVGLFFAVLQFPTTLRGVGVWFGLHIFETIISIICVAIGAAIARFMYE